MIKILAFLVSLLLCAALPFDQSGGAPRSFKHGGMSPPPTSPPVWTLIAIGTASGTGSGSSLTTSAINTTGSDLIVVNVSAGNPAGLVISDSASNTQWEVGPISSDTSNILFYLHNPTTSASHTITVTGGNSNISNIDVEAWSGSTSSPEALDHCTSAVSSSGTTISAGSITSSSNQELFVAGTMASGTTSAPNIGSGFTLSHSHGFTSGQHFAGGMGHLVAVSSGTSLGPTWTYSGNVGGSAALAAFRSSGSGTICGELTIASVGPTSGSYAANTANAVVTPNVSAALSPNIPFYGSFARSGANTGGFHLVGNTLEANPSGTTGVGPFTDVTITASQPGVTSGTVNPTLTGTSGIACANGQTPFTGTIPTEASNASLTTCAINFDFSNSLYATPSNWIDCTQTDTTKLIHIGSQLDPISGGIAPCSAISQVTDPVSPNPVVLNMQWLTSYSGAGCGGNGCVMMSTSLDGTHNLTFPNFYAEIVARIDNRSGSGPVFALVSAWQGQYYGSTIIGNDLEQDFFELANFPTGGGDSGIHNHLTGTPNSFIWSTAPSGVPGWDVTTYHKYGFLSTSDGSTHSYGCSFVDDVFQGCLDMGATGQQYFQRNYALWTNIAEGGNPPDTAYYLQYERIWTCSAWALPAGTIDDGTHMCNGTILSSSGGLSYWHN